jgi:hypothetical protein
MCYNIFTIFLHIDKFVSRSWNISERKVPLIFCYKNITYISLLFLYHDNNNLTLTEQLAFERGSVAVHTLTVFIQQQIENAIQVFLDSSSNVYV